MTAEDKTAAALRALTRDVEALARRVDLIADGLGQASESAGSAHRAITRLSAAVTALANATTERADAGADDSDQTPAGQPWLTIDDPVAAGAALGELVEWLASVYVRYPGGELGDCWLWHPSVVAELLALRETWLEAHDGERASAVARLDWHDRHRPGVAGRVRGELQACGLAKHAADGPLAYRPARVPAAAMADQLAAWWADTHGATAAPPPTPDLLAEARAREAERAAADY